MNRIVLSTVVLFVFSLGITVFQVSCKKDAIAQNPTYNLPIATTERLGGVIVDGVTLKIDEKGVLSINGILVVPPGENNSNEDNFIVYGVEPELQDDAEQIWTMNEDGSGKKRVNLAIPPTEDVLIFSGMRATRGGKILFITNDDNRDVRTMYQCDKDGGNLKVMMQSSEDADFFAL